MLATKDNVSTISKGLQDGAFGPTLLDMTELYNTEIKVISVVIVVKAIGSIIGSSLGM